MSIISRIDAVRNFIDRRRYVKKQVRAIKRGLKTVTLPEGYEAHVAVRNTAGGPVPYVYVSKVGTHLIVGPQTLDVASAPVYTVPTGPAVQGVVNRVLSKMKNRSGLYSE